MAAVAKNSPNSKINFSPEAIGVFGARKFIIRNQGPVVQSIVSLTSSLSGQLVKCFTTLLPNTLKFFVEK